MKEQLKCSSYLKLQKARQSKELVRWPIINNPVGVALIPLLTTAIDFFGTSEEQKEQFPRRYYVKGFAFLGAGLGTLIGTGLCISGGPLKLFNANYSKFSDLMVREFPNVHDFSQVGGQGQDKLAQQEFWNDALNIFLCMLFIAAITVGAKTLFAHLGNAGLQYTIKDGLQYKQAFGVTTIQGVFGDSFSFLNYGKAWLAHQWKGIKQSVEPYCCRKSNKLASGQGPNAVVSEDSVQKVQPDADSSSSSFSSSDYCSLPG